VRVAKNNGAAAWRRGRGSETRRVGINAAWHGSSAARRSGSVISGGSVAGKSEKRHGGGRRRARRQNISGGVAAAWRMAVYRRRRLVSSPVMKSACYSLNQNETSIGIQRLENNRSGINRLPGSRKAANASG